MDLDLCARKASGKKKKKKIWVKTKLLLYKRVLKKNKEKWDLEPKLNYDKRKDNIVNLINLKKKEIIGACNKIGLLNK